MRRCRPTHNRTASVGRQSEVAFSDSVKQFAVIRMFAMYNNQKDRTSRRSNKRSVNDKVCHAVKRTIDWKCDGDTVARSVERSNGTAIG